MQFLAKTFPLSFGVGAARLGNLGSATDVCYVLRGLGHGYGLRLRYRLDYGPISESSNVIKP